MKRKPALVARKVTNGYEAFLCHLDGDIDHTGRVLRGYFREAPLVEALFTSGDVWQIGTSGPIEPDWELWNFDEVRNIVLQPMPVAFDALYALLYYGAKHGCLDVYLHEADTWTHAYRYRELYGTHDTQYLGFVTLDETIEFVDW